MKVEGLRAEHHREPLGIGERRPRLSWRTVDAPEAWQQTAYEVRVDRSDDASGVSTTGWLTDDDSRLRPWFGPSLTSRQRVTVQVRVRGRRGEEEVADPSDWSAPLTIEAGLLEPADWSAEMIAPGWDEGAAATGAVPSYRHEFDLGVGVASARLYATAQGVYHVWVNGRLVGDQVLAPGWTSYHHRHRYQTYDVTDLLSEGSNTVTALVGEGWYRGRIGFEGGRSNIYGTTTRLLAQLEITHTDGSRTVVGSSGDWRTAPSATSWSSIYDGETFDARQVPTGWLQAGFDSRGWQPARPTVFDLSRLVAPVGPPVRRTQEVAVREVLTTPSGATVLDFGQNLVGRLRVRAQGPAGTTLTFRHAEVLEGGELGTRPLRLARAEDVWTLAGTPGGEEWEPLFTFHGFRYASVQGWPGEFDPAAVTAVVCHSDLERTGWFECSDDMLNQLHENAVWGMRGNILDVPTDCPQRDERLGWTGDIQVFAPTASFLYDCNGFLDSWLQDLLAEQLAQKNGIPPLVVPDAIDPDHPFSSPEGNALAGWGDAVVVVPWVLFQRFGDVDVLRRQYPGMTAWVDAIRRITGDRLVWDQTLQLGDWLDPAAPPDNPMAGRTDANLVATAYFAYSAALLSRIARLLGGVADAERYAALAADVRAAFNREYVTPAGRVASDSQAAYALALEFGLLGTPAQVARAGERLRELVRDGGYRIATGFLGTPLIADALQSAGDVPKAYRMLSETSCPSFLYPVTMGATTIWERWDSMLPDGTINPGDMTSFNHYALGAVADWMHRSIAGIAPGAPGYRHVLVRPRPGGAISSASARLDSVYGRIEVAWRTHDDQVTIEVTIPPNTTAALQLRDGDDEVALSSGRHVMTLPFRRPDAAPEPRRPGGQP